MSQVLIMCYHSEVILKGAIMSIFILKRNAKNSVYMCKVTSYTLYYFVLMYTKYQTMLDA